MSRSSRYYANIPGNASQADLDDTMPPASAYQPMHLTEAYPMEFEEPDQFQKVQQEDEQLKHRIRLLRVISRILSTVLSIAVFIPIAFTLYVFLTTRDIEHDVTTPDGTERRTAWAKHTKAWPTYTYFGVALTSVLLNAAILIAYLRNVSAANIASVISATFTWIVMLGNLGVWIAAVILYRTEKDKGGVSNDLWGWTCSPAAEMIQHAFTEVKFNKFCNVQSASWYAGLLQVGSLLLTGLIYFFVMRRRGSKRRVRTSMMTERLMEEKH